MAGAPIQRPGRGFDWLLVLPLAVIVVMFGAVMLGTLALRPRDTRPATIVVMPSIAAGFKLDTLSDEFFDFEEVSLKAGRIAEVDRLADKLKNEQATEILIIGYADARGEKAVNAEFSQGRAKTVFDRLAARDVKAIQPVGVGEDMANQGCGKLIPSERTECYDKDRRVEIWRRPAQGKAAVTLAEPEA